MNFVVIGSGSIAQRYVAILNTDFDAKITIISDFQSVALCEYLMMSRSQGKEIFEENSLFFDAIIIASENKSHLEDFNNFSKFSNKILFEKPLLNRPLTNRENSNLEKFTGEVRVSSPLRFHEAFTKINSHIQSIGDLNIVEVRCQSWLPSWRPNRDYRDGFWNDSSQGGVLREIIHELDYLGNLFGPLAVEWVSSTNSKALGLKVESGVSAILRTASGLIIDLRLDFSTHENRRYLRIDGDLGSLHWNVLEGTLNLTASSHRDSIVFKDDLDRNKTFKRQIDSLLNPNSWQIQGTSVEEAENSLILVDEMYRQM